MAVKFDIIDGVRLDEPSPSEIYGYGVIEGIRRAKALQLRQTLCVMRYNDTRDPREILNDLLDILIEGLMS